MTEKKGIFEKLRTGLSKTRNGFLSGLNNIIGRGKIDEDFFEGLEELLITADVGVHSASRIISGLREDVKKNKLKEIGDVEKCLKERILKIINHNTPAPPFIKGGGGGVFSFLIFIVGVKGPCKTNIIWKICSRK